MFAFIPSFLPQVSRVDCEVNCEMPHFQSNQSNAGSLPPFSHTTTKCLLNSSCTTISSVVQRLCPLYRFVQLCTALYKFVHGDCCQSWMKETSPAFDVTTRQCINEGTMRKRKHEQQWQSQSMNNGKGRTAILQWARALQKQKCDEQHNDGEATLPWCRLKYSC